MPDITEYQAQTVIEAAKAAAVDQGTAMNIAVVDAGGNLKAFLRMDDAWLGSIDISIKKARTARFFDMESGSAVSDRGVERWADQLSWRHPPENRRDHRWRGWGERQHRRERPRGCPCGSGRSRRLIDD
jgi:hypothetical protein